MNRIWRTMFSLGLVIVMSVMLSGCRAWDESLLSDTRNHLSTDTYLANADKIGEGEEYVLAQQTGVLADDWHEFTVKLNSVVVTLPCTAIYLEGVGLEMDTSFMSADTLVNHGNRESVYFTNEFGDAILVTFMNPDRTPRTLKNCLITGIAVTEYDLHGGHLTVTFPGGVELHKDKYTALIKYGGDYEIYESDSVHMYTWHDENSYYKSCEIDYDATTQKATSMFINY